MGLNILTLLQNYSAFKQMIAKSTLSPEEMLNQELNRRGVNRQQFEEMIKQAQTLAKLFGIK